MHPERDDAAYQLRREEVGELRGKRCNAGREVVAPVVCPTARVDNSFEIRLVCLGNFGAGAYEDKVDAGICRPGSPPAKSKLKRCGIPIVSRVYLCVEINIVEVSPQ